ncbi:MAG: hypothetical protein II722_08465 [Ruminococcus sp.]|nr:hypothetical protein [Ruminococcus sp.]
MDKVTMVICLFIGIIQIILIFSVIRTAENTQRMKNILEKISNDLSSITIHKPENATICPKCKQSAFDSKSGKCSSCGYDGTVHRYRGENGEWVYVYDDKDLNNPNDNRTNQEKEFDESTIDFDSLSKAMKE